MNTKKCTIETIPAQPCLRLSEIVYFYLLTFVPKGRLTRREDIEKFLQKKFDIPRIEFERPINLDMEYWIKFIDNVPMHRVVSSYGYIESGDTKKLISEGFELEQKIANRNPKIKDYKRLLFNFDKETNISLETLKKIDREKDFQV